MSSQIAAKRRKIQPTAQAVGSVGTELSPGGRQTKGSRRRWTGAFPRRFHDGHCCNRAFAIRGLSETFPMPGSRRPDHDNRDESASGASNSANGRRRNNAMSE